MELIIGLIIGIVLGLTGAGGSIFAVPLFLLFTDMSVSNAMGIALGAVAVSASYGTLAYGRKNILWIPAFLLIAGGVLTAPLGKWAALHIHETYLVLGFSFLALVIALRMWQQTKTDPQATEVVRASTNNDAPLPDGLMCRLSPTGQFQLKPRCLSGLVIGGLIIGFTSGLFGVGGGFLIIPLLIYLSQLDMRIGVATSLFVIAIISSTGFVSHLYLSPDIHWLTLSKIMLASTLGMILSQFFSAKLAGAKLQKTFSVLLMCVSIFTLVEKLS